MLGAGVLFHPVLDTPHLRKAMRHPIERHPLYDANAGSHHSSDLRWQSHDECLQHGQNESASRLLGELFLLGQYKCPIQPWLLQCEVLQFPD